MDGKKVRKFLIYSFSGCFIALIISVISLIKMYSLLVKYLPIFYILLVDGGLKESGLLGVNGCANQSSVSTLEAVVGAYINAGNKKAGSASDVSVSTGTMNSALKRFEEILSRSGKGVCDIAEGSNFEYANKRIEDAGVFEKLYRYLASEDARYTFWPLLTTVLLSWVYSVCKRDWARMVADHEGPDEYELRLINEIRRIRLFQRQQIELRIRQQQRFNSPRWRSHG